MSENHTPITPGSGPSRTFAPAPVSGPVEMMIIHGHAACMYDLNSQFLGKRRMQYNLGDAPLDNFLGMKDNLTKLQDEKLTSELMDLYSQLLPTPDSERRRSLFTAKIEGILRKEWPETKFKAHVFGSSGNMLCTSDSDGMRSRAAYRS
jgi:DNA polymerase sigma